MKHFHLRSLLSAVLLLFVAGSPALAQWQVPSGQIPVGLGAGTGFASSPNLFWDRTNSRLGIGTNAPVTQVEIKGPNSTFTNPIVSVGTPLQLQMSTGSPGTPISSISPSVGISRVEAINQDTQGGQNAALMINLSSNNTSNPGSGIIAQGVALSVQAKQTGSGDIVGGFFTTINAGNILSGHHYASIALYSNAVATGTSNQAVAYNGVITNSSGTDCSLASHGVGGAGCYEGGIFLQAHGANLHTMGIGLYKDGGAAAFDVGYYVYPGAVATSAFKSTGFDVGATGIVTGLSYKISDTLTYTALAFDGTYTGIYEPSGLVKALALGRTTDPTNYYTNDSHVLRNRAGSTTFATASSVGVTGLAFIPNSSTVPSNGMYLPAANTLGWAINSAAELQLTSTALSPAVDGGNSLGTTTLGWQNLFANTGFVLNIENGDWVASHTAGILTVGTGDLRVTTAGSNSASVATVGGTQELTNKTLNASVAKGTWTASGTWTLPAHSLGGTVSGGGNTIDNVVIGPSTPLAGTFNSLALTKNQASPTAFTITNTNAGGYANFNLITDAGTFNFFAQGTSVGSGVQMIWGGSGNLINILNNSAAFYYWLVGGGTQIAALDATTGFLTATPIRSNSATGGLGYATGAGGTVTQATSKSTGVTLNKATGAITMNNAALAAGAIVSFTLTNSAIASTDYVGAMHESGGTLGAYTINCRATGSGTAGCDVRNNTGGSLSEAIVIRFFVGKSVNSFLLNRDIDPALNDNSPAFMEKYA